MGSTEEEKRKGSRAKSSQKEAYQNLRKFEKELNTVCSNVEIFLEKSRFRQNGQEKDMVRSWLVFHALTCSWMIAIPWGMSCYC